MGLKRYQQEKYLLQGYEPFFSIWIFHAMKHQVGRVVLI